MGRVSTLSVFTDPTALASLIALSSIRAAIEEARAAMRARRQASAMGINARGNLGASTRLGDESDDDLSPGEEDGSQSNGSVILDEDVYCNEDNDRALVGGLAPTEGEDDDDEVRQGSPRVR